jgi:hypothetical protein
VFDDSLDSSDKEEDEVVAMLDSLEEVKDDSSKDEEESTKEVDER